MNISLLKVLVDPFSKTPLQLKAREKSEEGEICEGTLYGSESREYLIRHGIPRFVLTEDKGQRQTENSFAFKWQQRNTYESSQMFRRAQDWLVERYGFSDVGEMRSYFAGRQRILDVGCGGGFSTSLWMNEDWHDGGDAEWVGADISVAIDVARDRLGTIPNTHFLQADVLQLPFKEESFDTIFSEGVLHHTPSTMHAFKALVPLLASGGELLVYVYRRKGAIREFTDDYVRGIVSAFPAEEAWEMLKPLTKLGQALAKIKADVEVPEDIPYLGIKAGKLDIQRFIYWNVAKLFWNDTMSFEENHHVNFDWYHPIYAHRQSEEDIKLWCEQSDLRITHFDVQEAGITVRAFKA
jgi:arsenite methyltransferase